MKIALERRRERLDLDIQDDRLIGVWNGPEPIGLVEALGQLRGGLERSASFPPLSRAVVPGDRVALPIDPEVPEAGAILNEIAAILSEGGVDRAAIGVLDAAVELSRPAPETPGHQRHDPQEPDEIAYLANTSAGRRVYLNRLATDADVVVPIGLLGFDEAIGFRGPWTTIFPGLTDRETRTVLRSEARPEGVGRGGPLLDEVGEIGWLLGHLYAVGIVPAASGTGIAEVIAGPTDVVRQTGIERLKRSWTFQSAAPADLVIASIDSGGTAELARGLASAARLVRRGGKIAVLSEVEGPVGACLTRIRGLDDPSREAPRALRGLEGEPDALAARQLSEAIAWADVYLLSALEDDLVEDLAMIPIASADEARRLAELSPSVLVVGQADRTLTIPAEDRP